MAPGDPRLNAVSTSYQNDDLDVTAADAGRPVAPRRTKRDIHQQGQPSERHHNYANAELGQSDETRDSMTNMLLSDTDENDNVLPAAETDDVTDSDVMTDNDGPLQIREYD